MLRLGLHATLVCSTAALTLPLSATAASQGHAAPAHDLHVASTKGTTVWFVESSRNTQDVEVGQHKMKVSFEILRTFRISIKQVDGKGNRIAEIEVARVSGKLTMPGQPGIAFDSEDDPDEQATQNAAGMSTWINRTMASVGQPFLARIDANGEIAGSIAGVAHEIRDRNANSNINESDLADLAVTAFGRLPTEPTPIGGTWNFVQSGTDAMRVARHATMTLREVTEQAFSMDLSGTIKKGEPRPRPVTGSKDADETEAQLAEMTKALTISDGKLTGSQTISRHDGLVIETSSESTFRVDAGAAGKNQKMDIVVQTTLRRTTEPKLKASGSWAKAQRRRPATRGMLAEARIAKSQSDVKMLADAVRFYYAKNGKLPASLQVLATQDENGRSEIRELPADPWGNAYKLLPGEKPRNFQVISAGPDGNYGSADDLSSRKK